jgi:hypothetical protein
MKWYLFLLLEQKISYEKFKFDFIRVIMTHLRASIRWRCITASVPAILLIVCRVTYWSMEPDSRELCGVDYLSGSFPLSLMTHSCSRRKLGKMCVKLTWIIYSIHSWLDDILLFSTNFQNIDFFPRHCLNVKKRNILEFWFLELISSLYLSNFGLDVSYLDSYTYL